MSVARFLYFCQSSQTLQCGLSAIVDVIISVIRHARTQILLLHYITLHYITCHIHFQLRHCRNAGCQTM